MKFLSLSLSLVLSLSFHTYYPTRNTCTRLPAPQITLHLSHLDQIIALTITITRLWTLSFCSRSSLPSIPHTQGSIWPDKPRTRFRCLKASTERVKNLLLPRLLRATATALLSFPRGDATARSELQAGRLRFCFLAPACYDTFLSLWTLGAFACEQTRSSSILHSLRQHPLSFMLFFSFPKSCSILHRRLCSKGKSGGYR